MNLSFKDFYRLVTGFSPFSWQERFAEEALSGRWPNRVALPTGTGKSSLVEIWAYCLAREANQSRNESQTPMRLVYVVDRRLVVDAVYERAKRLARMLMEADRNDHHPLHEVAVALRNYGAEVPLVAAALRGGMVRETLWVDAPNQLAVLTATVDQAGSRLLFRGYGISHHQYPIQAGLLGCDTLFVVDEAHLNPAFVQTLEGVRRLQSLAEIPVRPPLRVVAMSATLGATAESQDTFVLSPEEREELSHRLAKPKFCVFREADSKSPFETSVVKAVLEMAERVEYGVVAVIVNRVDTARIVFEQLRDKGEAVLLIGRARPFDRDKLLRDWLQRLSPDRDRTRDDGIRFVVATQTVEVGADFDFDGLVTELAPLSALRQRLGRLNRVGLRDEARAIIVRRKDKDHVYDKKVLDEVWKWLTGRLPRAKRRQEQTLDLCDQALTRILEQEDPPAEVPALEAPWLSRPYVEQWSQTSLTPYPDPDVGPFLHGKTEVAPEVQVVWRGDITKDLLEKARSDETILRNMNDQLALAPPSSYEAISLPVWAVRAWLKKLKSPGVTDLEGEVDPEPNQQPSETELPVLRYNGIRSAVIMPDGIRPGDTVIVPAEYGGADEYGWNPEHQKPVRDIGDLAGRSARIRQRLRLYPELLPSWFPEPQQDKEYVETWKNRLNRILEWLNPDKYPNDEEAEETFTEQLLMFIEELAEAVQPDVEEVLKEWLQTENRQWVACFADSADKSLKGIVLVWRSEKTTASTAPTEDPVTDEGEESSLIGGTGVVEQGLIPLATHCREVSELARQYAIRCGLSTELVETVAAAGLYHDIGKAEPRFQVMLFGGDEAAAAAATEPMAKSGMDPRDTALLRSAQELSGYPRGKRHEEMSVGLLLGSVIPMSQGCDRELLLHLVGSHHGRGRPFFPVVRDPNPSNIELLYEGILFTGSSVTGLERLDSGWSEQFWKLQNRYGFWGLAYLEAILRLADYRVSENEMRKVSAP